MDEAQQLAPITLYLTLFPLSLLNGLATAVNGASPLGEEYRNSVSQLASGPNELACPAKVSIPPLRPMAKFNGAIAS